MYVVFKSYVRKKKENYGSYLSATGCVSGFVMSRTMSCIYPPQYDPPPVYDDNAPKHNSIHVKVPQTKTTEED